MLLGSHFSVLLVSLTGRKPCIAERGVVDQSRIEPFVHDSRGGVSADLLTQVADTSLAGFGLFGAFSGDYSR